MGFLDNLAASMRQANEALNKSLYDPPRLEVDGIVHETDIPEVDYNYKDPEQLGYPHSDFTRDPGTEEHVVTENALVPGGEFPSDDPPSHKKAGTRDNPDYSIDAASDSLGSFQYGVNTNVERIVEPSLLRTEITLINTSSTQTLYFSGNAAAANANNGISLQPGQSVSFQYNGVIYASASANGGSVVVAELWRK